MNEIIMMPTMAKQRINLGEFAEEATIVVEDAVKTRAAVNFLEANTEAISILSSSFNIEYNSQTIPKDNTFTNTHNGI